MNLKTLGDEVLKENPTADLKEKSKAFAEKLKETKPNNSKTPEKTEKPKRKRPPLIVTFTKKQIKENPKLEARLKKSRIRAPEDAKNSIRRSYNTEEAYEKTLAYINAQFKASGKTRFTTPEIIEAIESYGFSFWSAVNSSLKTLVKEGILQKQVIDQTKEKSRCKHEYLLVKPA